jgi:hypothetical protein
LTRLGGKGEVEGGPARGEEEEGRPGNKKAAAEWSGGGSGEGGGRAPPCHDSRIGTKRKVPGGGGVANILLLTCFVSVE